jgi:hypothetical protein
MDDDNIPRLSAAYKKGVVGVGKFILAEIEVDLASNP